MSWTPKEILEIDGENYALRSLVVEDLTDQMVAWFSDPDVMKFVDLPKNLNQAQVGEFVSRFDNEANFCLGIFDNQSGQCIGFYHIYCNLRARNARTAVVIGEKDYWGKGVVIETRTKILDFLFDTLSLHKVYGAVFARNLPAVFNYKAQGFRCEGVLKEDCPTPDGGWHDIYRFAMLSHEWKAKKEGADP